MYVEHRPEGGAQSWALCRADGYLLAWFDSESQAREALTRVLLEGWPADDGVERHYDLELERADRLS